MVASYAIASVASDEKRFIALLNPQLVSVICLEIDETIIKFMCVLWLKKTIFGVMFSLKGNFKWDLKRYWFLRRCPSHTVWACQNHRKNTVPRCCASFFGCINKNQLNLTSKSDEPKTFFVGQKKNSHSWWFQPILTICSSNWSMKPQESGWKFKKYLSCHHLEKLWVLVFDFQL